MLGNTITAKDDVQVKLTDHGFIFKVGKNIREVNKWS